MENSERQLIIRVAVIEGDYARDTQIFTGDSEDAVHDIMESDCWSNVKSPSQFLGICKGSCEEAIRERMACEWGVVAEAITLYPVDKGR